MSSDSSFWSRLENISLHPSMSAITASISATEDPSFIEQERDDLRRSYLIFDDLQESGNQNETQRQRQQQQQQQQEQEQGQGQETIDGNVSSNSTVNTTAQSSITMTTSSSVDLSLHPSMLSSSIFHEQDDSFVTAAAALDIVSDLATIITTTSITSADTKDIIDADTANMDDNDSGKDNEDNDIDRSNHNHHPSASFLNVGSHLLSSNNLHLNSPNSSVHMGDFKEMEDTDASTALAIALQDQQFKPPSSSAESENGDKNTHKTLKEEYTCQLCHHIIVGASLLDCASGENHVFCTLCMEHYEFLQQESKYFEETHPTDETFESGRWVLLSPEDDCPLKYPIKEHETLNKNYAGASSMIATPITTSTSTSTSAPVPTENEQFLIKKCPTCQTAYTHHIPCRSLDVAISNFIHSSSFSPIKDVNDANDTKQDNDECEEHLQKHHLTQREKNDFMLRQHQWSQEKKLRAILKKQEQIETVMKEQEEEFLFYHNLRQKKKGVWKNVVGSAASTLAILLVSVCMASRRQQGLQN